MTFTIFIHAALIVLALCSSVPQIVRLIRVRDRAGVSPAHATGAIAQGVLWILHSTAAVPGVLWLVVALQSMFISAAAAELWLLVRLRAPIRAAVWSGAALTASGGVLVLAAGPIGWGIAAIAGAWWKFGPAVASAYRARNPRGVSWPTWAMISARGVGSVFYGVLHADPVIVVGSFTPAIAGALILARIAITRRRPAGVPQPAADANPGSRRADAPSRISPAEVARRDGAGPDIARPKAA